MSQASRTFFASELGLRIVSAIVLLFVVLTISWFGDVALVLLSLALAAVLYYEWQALVRQTPFDGTEIVLTLGFAGLLLLILLGLPWWGLGLFLGLGLILELTAKGQEKSDVRWIGLGALYCAIPAFALPIIREHSFALLVFVFLVVWVTDVAGYFVGRAFGGPKLMKSVSPKKTWSGALGGLAGAVIVGLLFQYFVPDFKAGYAWVFAIILSVASQAGDLFESSVKRAFDIKDSSNLIPGHGGFLDRVDGLITASLFMALILLVSPPYL
ncbi:MAG: phosphatidate cytidylyltransferase [Pseudomonadota bacterium]